MDSNQNSAQLIKAMNQRLAKTYAEELVLKVLASMNKDVEGAKKESWTADLEQYYQTNLNKVILS